MKHQSCHHIETNQLICRANALTGFYMMATFAFNELMDILFARVCPTSNIEKMRIGFIISIHCGRV